MDPRRVSAGALAVAVAFTVSCDRSAGGARSVEVTSQSGVALVLIPSGEFTMGASGGRPEEGPPHRVFVSAFAMDKYEVTQDQYTALEISSPAHFKDPRRPVEQVRWSDAALFCNERSRAEGLEPCYDEASFACDFEATGYRLPTEAEWEYAARAGSKELYVTGAAPADLASHACYAGNARKKTDVAGRKKPNAWGLCDMLGNVSEWVNDVYDPAHYRSRSPGVERDPRGPPSGKKRVLRGGSWKSSPEDCRVTARVGEVPGITDACFARDTFGFRCVRRLSPEELELIGGVPSDTPFTGN